MTQLTTLTGARIPHPSNCFIENFTEGLTPYVTRSGNRALFTVSSSGVYKDEMTVASQSAGVVASIGRTFPPRRIDAIHAKFLIQSINADDAAEFGVTDSTGTFLFYFNPAREQAFDPSQRPVVGYPGQNLFAAAASLGENEWYQLDVSFEAGVGNTVATITRILDGFVAGTVVSTLSTPPFTSGEDLIFFADSGLATSPVVYADIELCTT